MNPNNKGSLVNTVVNPTYIKDNIIYMNNPSNTFFSNKSSLNPSFITNTKNVNLLQSDNKSKSLKISKKVKLPLRNCNYCKLEPDMKHGK